MCDGVFHYRLQQQTRQHIVQTVLCDVIAHFKTIRIPDTHQINIAVQHIQFFPQGVKTNVAAERARHDLHQGFRHFLDARISGHLRHKADGVQRVDNKMRIDLTLQSLDLRTVFPPLRFRIDLQHIFQTQHHLVEGYHQVLNFRLTHRLHLHIEIVIDQFLHSLCHCVYRVHNAV